MKTLPVNPTENATPESLHAFLTQCRALAVSAGRPQLVSISLAVDALDPLAVLESIFDPRELHFYAERPDLGSALAGAETALLFEASGAGRFAAVQRWIDETLENTIAIGAVDAPFGGPHFFTSFTFLNETESGDAFPAARAFVPRWQVSRAGAVTTAVANFVVAPDAELASLAERVWRAHAKFLRFEYRGPGIESSTGVPPVPPRDEMHGRDARATIRQGAYLPHLRKENGIYAVTFRLADSVPAPVLAQWQQEKRLLENRLQQNDPTLKTPELMRLLELHSEKFAGLLDAGSGACRLKNPEIAELVAAALRHFDGQRYELHEWCVMPNHVHAILRPLGENRLEQIVQAWKSYTSKRANAMLGAEGQFWHTEYYDHLIRDEADYLHAVEYVRNNPVKAGLAGWRWQGSGPGIESSTGVPPVPSCDEPHGRDARATQETEAGDYRAAVGRGLERIVAGEFTKIVLARAKQVVADEPLHPLEMLNGLRQRFPDCYAFSLANGQGQSFIGASPERLARVSKGVLETEALAGSARRGAGASEDAALGASLLRSEKDVHEQRLVVEAIVRRLAALGLEPEFPSQLGLRKLANVQHLHTPIRATLPDGVRLLQALAALHPTPAVGGSPRDAAVGRIRELEGFSRGLYAGAIGWVNARDGGEFFVGLRSALVDGPHATLYAGAGIVAGSTPEKEFAETELKFKAMLDALTTA